MSMLATAMRWQAREGQPLPMPYKGLAALRAFFRRGQISMVAAPSGAGKTAWITDWAITLQALAPGVSCLMFSADSDRGTVGNRTMASVCGYTLDEVERVLKDPDEAIWDRLSSSTRHITYCFDSTLTPAGINAELATYTDANGKFPDVIIVDNLIDVVFDPSKQGGGMDDYNGHANSAKWLKDLARLTGAAVIVLHHVTGPFADTTDPIPMSAILGKVDRHFRLILTIHRPEESVIGISVVKNSNGPMDPKGQALVDYLPCDLSRMWIGKEM